MGPYFGLWLLVMLALAMTVFFTVLSIVTSLLRKEEPHLKLCDCGHNVDTDEEWIDSVYPVNRERTKWNICCQVHNTGCGRTVYGDTLPHAYRRWNNGETDEYII